MARRSGGPMWRRRYRYEEAVVRETIRVITPVSEDAPYDEQDARFWARLVVFLLVAVTAIGVIVWLLSR